MPLHCTTRHFTTTTTHYFTLQHARLHYTMPRYSTQHYSTLQYTTLIRPHHNYNCNCNCNYTTTTTPLRYSYNYRCATPHYIQQFWWGDHCNHCNHSTKNNSDHLSVHQWICSAIRDSQQPTSIGFLFWNFRHRLVRYYWHDIYTILWSHSSHYGLI